MILTYIFFFHFPLPVVPFSLLGGTDYGRHPDFKLAYVTLANGVIFEFPQVVHEEGEGDIDKDVKDQERADKYNEYLKQQNWKKKFGGPDWFC